MPNEKPPSTPEELDAARASLDIDTAAGYLTMLTGVAVSGVKTLERPEDRERTELALAYGGKLVDLYSFVCDPSIVSGAMILYRRAEGWLALYELNPEFSAVFQANGIIDTERWLPGSDSKAVN
jgi:hypothetical protein